ncbi:MAG TPA: hypothetical protein VGN13_00470, partial [Solirubrobacteraceae bacterium]
MAISTKPSGEEPAPAASQQSERVFRSLSGEPVRELYTRADLPAGIGAVPPAGDPVGVPGEFPFTRGI